MKILIKEILGNKLEIILNYNVLSESTVVIYETYYEKLLNKRRSVKKLLEYIFEFLLDREKKELILSFYKLDTISKCFLSMTKR